MKNRILIAARIAKSTAALLVAGAVFITATFAQASEQSIKDAIAALTEKIAAAPNDDTLYAQRANHYFNLKKLDESLADANQALKLNPKNNGALIVRGGVKSNKRDFDGAIADYSEVIRLYPTRAFRAYFYRGEVYEVKGDYDKALEDYGKAREIDLSIGEAVTRARMRVYDKQIKAGKSGSGKTSAAESKIPAVWKDGDFIVPDSEYIVGKIVSHDGKSYPGIIVLGKLLDESKVAMYISTAKSKFKENWGLGVRNKIIVKTGTTGYRVYEAFVVDASEENLKKAQTSNDFKSDLTQFMDFKYLKLAFDRSLVLVKKDAAHPSLKVEVVDILDTSNLSVLRRQSFPITNERKAYADLLDGEIKAGNLDEAKAIYQHLESLAAKSGESDEAKTTRKTNLTKLYSTGGDLKAFVDQEMTKYEYTEAEKQAIRGGTIPK